MDRFTLALVLLTDMTMECVDPSAKYEEVKAYIRSAVAKELQNARDKFNGKGE